MRAMICGHHYDDAGYATDIATTRLHVLVKGDGAAWETDDYGHPLAPITKRPDGVLVVCGGTFIPDEGELARLSREHGCAL